MTKLMKAIRDWNWEAETVAAKLIKEGTPPSEAIDMAHKIVSEKRRARLEKSAGRENGRQI